MNKIILILLGFIFIESKIYSQELSKSTEALRLRLLKRISMKDLQPNERSNYLNNLSLNVQSNILKMRLDSFVYFDSTASLNTFKTLYFYDAKQRNNQFDFFLWDNVNKNWMGFLHADFIYNNKNQIVETHSGGWNSQTNTFDINNKRYNEYNSSGQLIKDSTLVFEFGIWGLDEKNEYTIINNQVTKAIESSFIDGQWVFYKKNEYRYDGSGNLIEDVESDWDEIEEKWFNGDKINYTYNVANQIIEQLTSSWNDFDLIYVNDYRIQTTYDGGGLKTSQLQQEWDNQNVNWINFELFEVSYSASKNPIKILIYSWNKTKGEWSNINLFLNTFDEVINKSSLILPVLDIFYTLFQFDAFANGRPLAVAYYEQRKANGSWGSRNRISFHYSPHEISYLSDLKNNNSFIAPNPSSDLLRIDLELTEGNYFIYSIDGKEFLHGRYNSSEEIKVTNLPKGVYFLNICSDKNNCYQNRFVKM